LKAGSWAEDGVQVDAVSPDQTGETVANWCLFHALI